MRANEFRLNKATGQWVINAPGRGKRPNEVYEQETTRQNLPLFEKNCPFCPGNEDMLPAITLQMAGEEPEKEWRTRVAPNKFPALTSDVNTSRRVDGIYVTMPGYGKHEVVIETPHHNLDIPQMSIDQVEMIIETYHRRYADLMSEHRNLTATIFRNHGPRAGTSLIHPHSQIIVTGIVPHHLRLREDAAQQFFDKWGHCVYCDILKYEIDEGKRMVLENDSFAAFVPYAAEVPFEVWILPREHQADFGSISERQKKDLAASLREVLGKLHLRLNDPDYNYIINTSAQYRANEPQLHWFVQVRPRLTTPAGFEIGSGISINPSTPELDADFLKNGAH